MGTGTTIVPKSGASSGVAMLPHHNRDIAIKSSESEEIEEAKMGSLFKRAHEIGKCNEASCRLRTLVGLILVGQVHEGLKQHEIFRKYTTYNSGQPLPPSS
jgi:hypothetical protein